MKKWCRAVLFLLPLFIFTGWVNWYVDSYAILRVTYDDIAAQMEARSEEHTSELQSQR